MKKVLITIPCYNEQIVLERTIMAVRSYAAEKLSSYDCTVHILDNNSNDKTGEIAKRLATQYDNVITSYVSTPGRGVAIRTAWTTIPGYDIYAYMDADLSTDIKDFALIIKHVDEGCDLVTGSRYLKDSVIEREPLRRLLSLIYNLLIRTILKADFRDAQCGFKAMSAKLVRELVDKTTDHGWFWDTELMILACRNGYCVKEVPVAWREARDELRKSTVAVFTEVFKNLKNIAVMRIRLSNGFYAPR